MLRLARLVPILPRNPSRRLRLLPRETRGRFTRRSSFGQISAFAWHLEHASPTSMRACAQDKSERCMRVDEFRDVWLAADTGGTRSATAADLSEQ